MMNILVHVVLAFIAFVAVTAILIAGIETIREERAK